MPNHPQHLFEIVRLLRLITERPGIRTTALPQDPLEDALGPFDAWFDGGALRYETMSTSYRFWDGAMADVDYGPGVRAMIALADGREFVLRPVREGGGKG